MRFLDPLDVRLLDESDGGRAVYALLREFRYRSDVLGKIVIVPAGFVTDFESVPVLLQAVVGLPCPWAGVIHDWLYQSHEAPKDACDSTYREALLNRGVDPVRAEQRYAAVSLYGKTAYDSGPSRRRIIPVA